MDRHETSSSSALRTIVRLVAASTHHANDGVLISATAPIFTESIIVHANPAFAALTGYGLTELTGRPVGQLCALAPERDRLERLSEALGRGENVFGLILTRARNGSDIALEWRISALFGESGSRVAWIVHMCALDHLVSKGGASSTGSKDDKVATNPAIQDIGPLRTAELALRAAKDEAERANRGKSRFLAAASHDLRQPLHALELLHAALSESLLPEEFRPIVSDMGDCLGTMGRILHTLLDISEIEAGAVSPQFEEFPVNRLLTRLDNEFRPGAEEKGLALRVVPSSAIIRSDPDLIERILGNFLSNAARHTDRGRILLGCRRRGRRLRIAVLDCGPGIDPAEIEGLFEEFRQLDTARSKADKGLGLGLAIAKRLAELMEHEIHVTSIPFKGSQFALEVELGAAPRVKKPAPEHRPKPRGYELTNAEIILIEDDLAVAAATQRFLETWGCRVTSVASGAQAQTAVDALGQPPDLIIADYRLPDGRSGMEVIEQLQDEAIGAVPALIVTGDTSPESLETLSKSGFSVLHKPVRPAKLRALVSHLLSEQGANSTGRAPARP